MILDTTTGEHLTGLGDMVSLAWIAEATRGTDKAISFLATKGNYDVLALFGQPFAAGSGTRISVSAAYRRELADRGSRSRLDYVRELLGVAVPPKRPTARHSPEAIQWATDVRRRIGAEVLLFPQAEWLPRAWPACYWVDLAWLLQAAGRPVAVMLKDNDSRFGNVPHYFWGQDLSRVAALIAQAGLVIGNDSGPAHIAGTLGVPTLALMGPTRGSCVFAHIPEVTPLAVSGEPDCVGCHFAAPFRAACDQGCQALYALTPKMVLRCVETMLR